mmetsp:Transcript_24874/g.49492  ORF Transcript_24874/g.49492 Transcript_24874/m.49492 type:complete len:132 (-) Transcript_24874:33-428(-)
MQGSVRTRTGGREGGGVCDGTGDDGRRECDRRGECRRRGKGGALQLQLQLGLRLRPDGGHTGEGLGSAGNSGSGHRAVFVRHESHPDRRPAPVVSGWADTRLYEGQVHALVSENGLYGRSMPSIGRSSDYN